jgi:hypothetical protein
MKNEIILYRPDGLSEHIEVRLEAETVWLNRQQISKLFNRDVKTIGKHINQIFIERELDELSTVAKIATVQYEGERKVERQIEYYSLDVIISIGYRVKSKEGTQFRIWANKRIKDYLLKGFALNNRMNRVEDQVQTIADQVNQIELFISTHQLPTQGVFFDGQVFDAYELASRIIRSAQKTIILIDNYLDETSLLHLSKKNPGVAVHLLTKSASKSLLLDIQKANEQYGSFSYHPFSASHDRFLILDHEIVYHLGASLKDLGKKWFAFSKMEKSSIGKLLDRIDLLQLST